MEKIKKFGIKNIFKLATIPILILSILQILESLFTVFLGEYRQLSFISVVSYIILPILFFILDAVINSLFFVYFRDSLPANKNKAGFIWAFFMYIFTFRISFILNEFVTMFSYIGFESPDILYGFAMMAQDQKLLVLSMIFMMIINIFRPLIYSFSISHMYSMIKKEDGNN